jgi:hypothetical protein
VACFSLDSLCKKMAIRRFMKSSKNYLLGRH